MMVYNTTIQHRFNEENNHTFTVKLCLSPETGNIYTRFYIELYQVSLVDFTEVIIISDKYSDLIQNHQRGINTFLNCYLSKYLPMIFKKPEINQVIKYIYKEYKIKGWTIMKALTKLLSLHKRAIVSANHPDRLKLSGVFEEI